MNRIYNILDRAESGGRIDAQEALTLFSDAPLEVIAAAADRVRARIHPGDIVTWQIDRNVNITNVCVSGCKFCNFHVKGSRNPDGYITSIEEYDTKIKRMLELGGDQLLLQGGMHPHLDITFYEQLFRELKRRYPEVRLHALGPPEVWHIARISGLGVTEVLTRLTEAGLDSLPGAGAEILSTPLRREISPGKCSAEEWLEVMAEAHRLGIPTSATMMFGHKETPQELIAHLMSLRSLQDAKPAGAHGFIAFIAWPYCSGGTRLEREGVVAHTSADDYLRVVALARLVLDNIANIQASWLTVGIETGLKALRCGANDMGSIMIEENVVSSTGISGTTLDADRMVKAIQSAGFTPRLRDQLYNYR
ncbi:MAG: dehypoxanthine futalosine cyclase [Rikenellaceae bacterium]|nr:dehypoxanthine futalosine cyclase [Rikenellaceae bacterium]